MPQLVTIVAATLSWPIASARLPAANRGTQLFLLIEAVRPERRTDVVAITEPRTDVYKSWHPAHGTYDFITAVVTSQFAGGVTIRFTRAVMDYDYVPRVEQAEFAFPYTDQARYLFTSFGYITGFYRNSVEDFDLREFMPQSSPNQSMQPTAAPRTASLSDD